MSETTNGPLADLLAAIEAFPRPEITRVIVGAPLVPRDGAMKWTTHRVLWVGRDAWDAIPKETVPAAPWPTFTGIPVEFFDWRDHDHLFREFLRDALPPSPLLTRPTPTEDPNG